MTGPEHFDWAVQRAYAELDAGDDGAAAMSSIISDFYKHPNTASILTPELQTLFMFEVMSAGARGARRFIEGIPRPVTA